MSPPPPSSGTVPPRATSTTDRLRTRPSRTATPCPPPTNLGEPESAAILFDARAVARKTAPLPTGTSRASAADSAGFSLDTDIDIEAVAEDRAAGHGRGACEDRPLQRPEPPGGRRDGRGLPGPRPGTGRGRRAQDNAPDRPQGTLPLQARVPQPGRPVAPEPGQPVRAGGLGRPLVLHDGAGRGGRFHHVRPSALPSAPQREPGAGRSSRRPPRRPRLGRHSSPSRSGGSGRRCGNWRRGSPRCTRRGSCTATSSRRTCW